MKVTLLPENLREALDVASKASSTKHPYLPVVQNVLLDASPDGGLKVSGTDLRTRAWHTVSARVDVAGMVTLPPRALSDFLDACTDGEALTITVSDTHRAHLVCGRAQIKLAGLDPEGFPTCPDFALPAFDTTMAAPILAQVIGSTAFAAAPDESRPVLAGVNIVATGGRLTLAAVDGYRLAIRSTEIDEQAECSLIVLAGPLAVAGRALVKASSVRLVVDANASMLLLDSEAGCWAIQLIDGQFPDFERIIPRETTARVTVQRATLVSALRMIRGIVTTVTENNKTVSTTIAKLTISEGALAVRAGSTGDDQEADVEMDAVLDGEPMTIGFNGAYLRQAVEAIEGDSVLLTLAGPDRAAVITEASGAQDHRQISMPMFVARGSA